MLWKIFNFIVFVNFLFLFSCKTTQISNYIKFYDKSLLIYEFDKDSGSKYQPYADTFICKMIVRRGVFNNDYNGNYIIFYFEKPEGKENYRGDIFTHDGAISEFYFCLNKGNLYINDGINKEINPIGERIKKVIPKNIVLGQEYIYKKSDYFKRITYIKKETIFWHNKEIKDALKVSISFSNRYGQILEETFWFAKNIGVIKRINKYGQVGQLRF